MNGMMHHVGSVGLTSLIIEVKTDNSGTSASNQFTIPTNTSLTYNYDVETSDGYTASGLTGNHTITFPSGAGTHTITITGDFPSFYFNNSGDRLKILDILKFGFYSAGTTQLNAFYSCLNLDISASDIGDFSSTIDFTSAWRGCSGLTSFPLIDTSSANNFTNAWYNCSGLTSFPLIDTSSGTNFNTTWAGCSGLTSFPLIDTSSAIILTYAWNDCTGLATFPLIDTSSVTTFLRTWYGCSGLTSFPLLNTSSATIFLRTWQNCSGLTSFPSIDTSAGTNFYSTWFGCSGLTSFPLIDMSAGTDFTATWRNCTSLANFPANAFDGCLATNFSNAFTNTNLTQTSIDNILTSLDTSGTTKGTFDQSGGSAPSSTGETAIDNLRLKGWTITVTGGY